MTDYNNKRSRLCTYDCPRHGDIMKVCQGGYYSR